MPSHSPGDKAGPLHYTRSHVYNISDCLGKGATASVYLGRNRTTGTQVALKVFTSPESNHITQARLRETELLRGVSHRNIMQLLDCEQEVDTGNNVLVMPYCQCGSVYSLLEQPQNGFGFKESEFLRFLNDITRGLQYLNQKRIIHRDIKPGNIMKAIEEDGSSVYILTDFGAARELETEDETFVSIYGTEEYIHPGMFQRAVLRQPGQNKFDSSVDLWSLAVTVYHVATGTLPFHSYGGRNDSQMTFEIISGRKSGEISGIQRQPNGPIERSKHLPETCYLSRGLCHLLEPILAGLFEPDQGRALSFDEYFEAVNDIGNRKTLKVFFVQSCTDYILYLRKTDSFVHILETLAALTDVPSDRQIILMGHSELKDIVEIHEQVQTYPKSVQNAHLFLIEKDNYDIRKLTTFNLPPFPPLPVGSSLSSDASVARNRAACAYYIEWKTKQILNLQMLLLESKPYLRLYVEDIVKPIQMVIPELDKELALTRKLMEFLQLSSQNMRTFMAVLDVVHTAKGKELQDAVRKFSGDWYVEDILNKSNNRCEEIKVYLSVLIQRLKECSTTSPTDHLGCHHDDHCLTKVEHIRQGIQTVSTTFAKHKKYGELHPHEQFIHKVERDKLEDLSVKILSLFQGHCLPNLQLVHEAVNKQNSIVLKHLTRVGKVEANMKCVMDSQTLINEKINQMQERYQQASHLVKDHVKEILENPNYIAVKACKDIPNTSEGIPSTSSSVREEKAELMQLLLTELDQLGTEGAELDNLLSSNTESLRELKRMLENTSRLSLTSFASDKMSVECTDRFGSHSASEWTN